MSFERQVNFRISAEDHHLLEAAARDHGSVKGGILAGLRALEQQRLDAARPPKPPEPPEPEPRKPEDKPTRTDLPEPEVGEVDWWMPVAAVADTFHRSEATIRKWVAGGRAQARGTGDELEVDVATVQLERAPAAEWLQIKSTTLAKWTELGKAKATADGMYVFGDLEIPLSQANRRWDYSAAGQAKLAKRARDTAHGRMVRLLDAVELAE